MNRNTSELHFMAKDSRHSYKTKYKHSFSLRLRGCTYILSLVQENTILRSLQIFIYRGSSREHITDFQGRMLERYPRAELLRSLEIPSDELRFSTKQCEYLSLW